MNRHFSFDLETFGKDRKALTKSWTWRGIGHDITDVVLNMRLMLDLTIEFTEVMEFLFSVK